VLSCVLAVVWCAALAAAQSGLHGVGDVRGERGMGGGHGWFVFPDSGGNSATVYHLPPRRSGAGDRSALRVAATLAKLPAGIAAYRDQLYVVFEAPAPPPAFKDAPTPPAQVFMTGVVAAGGGRWVSSPPGRLGTMTPLPGGSEIVGVAGSDAGVFALLRDAEGLRVLRLGAAAWEPVAADTLPAVMGHVAVFGAPGGIGLVQRDDNGVRVLLGQFAQGEAQGSLSLRSVPLPVELGLAVRDPQARLLVCADHLVAVSAPEAGASRVWALPLAKAWRDADEPWRQIGTVDGLPDQFAIATLDSDGVVTFGWIDEPISTPPARAARRLMLRDLSVATGRLDGVREATLAAPVVLADYGVIAFSMLIVVGMVCVTILPVREGNISLPEGFGLAEPPRRAMAGALDFIIAMIIASGVRGISLREALTANWLTSSEGFATLGIALGGLIVVNGVMEAVTGRSVGKILAGCRVVGVTSKDLARGGGPVRLGLGRSLLRNLMKWLLPPIAAAVVLDPAGRHKADQLVGAAVVVPDAPEEPDPE